MMKQFSPQIGTITRIDQRRDTRVRRVETTSARNILIGVGN